MHTKPSLITTSSPRLMLEVRSENSPLRISSSWPRLLCVVSPDETAKDERGAGRVKMLLPTSEYGHGWASRDDAFFCNAGKSDVNKLLRVRACNVGNTDDAQRWPTLSYHELLPPSSPQATSRLLERNTRRQR